jgi:uncharacterized membrane protein (UPF0127 family)
LSFWLSRIETRSIGSHQLRLVQATSYAQGLRGVATLGTLDGMLFELADPFGPHGMGMDGVLFPLDVAFFTPDGQLIDRFSMPICGEVNCPAHIPSRAWKFAIEAPEGTLAWIHPGAVLMPLRPE